jgi:hypothetical protein
LWDELRHRSSCPSWRGTRSSPSPPKANWASAANRWWAAKTQPAKAAAPKPATNGGTTDKKRQAQAAKAPKAKIERKPIDAKLAQRAVTMRGKLDANGRPTSWAKIGYALKLVPEGAPKSQAGDAARRAYRQVKGADAPTGLSDY